VDRYLPQEPERRLTSILEELGSQGIDKSRVAVLGHSGGAFLGYDAALTKGQVFIHMGSTLNSKGMRVSSVRQC
jgi:predicted esterase